MHATTTLIETLYTITHPAILKIYDIKGPEVQFALPADYNNENPFNVYGCQFANRVFFNPYALITAHSEDRAAKDFNNIPGFLRRVMFVFAHELAHVKQFCTGDLKYVQGGCALLWTPSGDVYGLRTLAWLKSSGMYNSMPWEKDANKLAFQVLEALTYNDRWYYTEDEFRELVQYSFEEYLQINNRSMRL